MHFYIVLRFLHAHHVKHVLFHAEFYLQPRKRHTVNAVGFVLIGGTGIVRETFDQARALLLGYGFQKLFGEIHRQFFVFVFVGVSAHGVYFTVGKGEIRFDIEHGRAVQKIRARNDQFDSVFRALDALQLHAGKPDMIGAERGAAGENAHALIPAEARRTDGRRPALVAR